MGFNIKEYLINTYKKIGKINLFTPVYHTKFYWMKDNLTPQEQDALVLKENWKVVGNNLKFSINNIENLLK
jgi:hypothetical protein